MTEEQFKQLQATYWKLAKYKRLVETTEPRENVNEQFNMDTRWGLIRLGEILIMPDEMYIAMCQYAREQLQQLQTQFNQL